jgi:hypothetical protein
MMGTKRTRLRLSECQIMMVLDIQNEHIGNTFSHAFKGTRSSGTYHAEFLPGPSPTNAESMDVAEGMDGTFATGG